MRHALLLSTALLFGCGPSFAGKFAGTLSTSATCSDGSGGTNANAATWSILESGSQLTITAGGTCDPLSATQQGASATIAAKTCPPQTSGTVTSNFQITGGTLSLSEPSLNVASNSSGSFYDSSTGASGTCSGTTTGTLTRQQ